MMSKSFQMIILILIILFMAGCSENDKYTGNATVVNNYPTIVNFDFIQDSFYNVKSVKKRWSIDENGLFIFFEHAHNQEGLNIFAEEGEFDYPDDFDFENYCMLISYGRKIVNLECENDEYYGENWFFLIATFNEEYSGEKVFFYKIDKRDYLPSDLGMKCYIMDGIEKVYLGSNIAEINKPK